MGVHLGGTREGQHKRTHEHLLHARLVARPESRSGHRELQGSRTEGPRQSRRPHRPARRARGNPKQDVHYAGEFLVYLLCDAVFVSASFGAFPTGLTSATVCQKQVLNSWKTRRILPVDQLEGLLSSLRSATFQQSPSPLASTTTTNGHTKPQASSSSSSSSSFSRNDILRRIEDDRERHKRLRERIWVLPLPSLLELSSQSSTKLSTVLTTTSVNRSSTSPESPASPAGVANEGKLVSLAGYTREKAAAEAAATAAAAAASANSSVQSQGGVGDDTNGVSDTKESALDVEFEQAWEVIEQENPSGRLDESDLMAMLDENERCFGTSR